MTDRPRIAIVSVGGLFPSPHPERPAGPEELWANVRAGVDAARDVPPGRWLLDPREALDPRVPAPDKVYSTRGYYLPPISCDPAGLDIDPELLAQLDPVFHLTLLAGRQAWQGAITHALDR